MQWQIACKYMRMRNACSFKLRTSNKTKNSMTILSWANNLRVFVSVSAATNCRYFFISVVWSTTVGLGAGTKAMAVAGAEGAFDRKRGRRKSSALILVWSHAPRRICICNKLILLRTLVLLNRWYFMTWHLMQTCLITDAQRWRHLKTPATIIFYNLQFC